MTAAKLDTFLNAAMASGHTRYTIQSPRGHELARGELGPLITGEALYELCTDDARALVQGSTNEYALTVASSDAIKQSRYPLRVAGGGAKELDDVHKVDAPSTQTAGAVVGHLTRTVIELVRQNTTLAMGIVNRDKEYVHELERSRRAALNRDTEATLVGKLIDRESDDARTKREGWTRLLGEVASYLPAALKALPGAKARAIDTLRDGMTDQQLEQLATILGPIRLARLMAMADPQRLAAYFIDEIEPDQGRAVLAVLSEAQRRAFLPALGDFVQARERDAAAAAAAAASTAAAAQ